MAFESGGAVHVSQVLAPDDQFLQLGTGGTAKLGLETADANANVIILSLAEGGATDVPIFVVGDTTILNADLGFFDGLTEPGVGVIDDDGDSYILTGFASDDVAQILSNRPIEIQGVGSVVFNQAGNDVDFRVEGSSDAAALFVQGSSDAVIIGGGSSPALIMGTADLEVQGDFGAVSYVRTTADANQPLSIYFKSRSGGVITTGDILGSIGFQGHDGTDYNTKGAQIIVASTGTIATDKIPTNIEFHTALGAVADDIAKKWTILSTGVLEANGAQAIAVSTGILTLQSNAGNGDINLVPHGTGNVNILGTSVSDNYDLALLGDGVLMLNEGSAPTADATFGKIWTQSNNELFFQSGDGVTHLLHGDAFSTIWFHAQATVAVSIGAADTFTLVDSFTVIGKQDDLGNVTGSVSTNLLTIGSDAAGEYLVNYHGSISNAGGASKELVIVPGITLNTRLDITNVTDNTITPIVVTITAHSLEDGDMITIVDVLVNTAANGDWIVDNKTANTFEIVALDATASVGNGDYDEGTPTGEVSIFYPGNLISHMEVSQTDLVSIAADGLSLLAAGDTVGLYVANLDDTSNLQIAAVSFDILRVGD